MKVVDLVNCLNEHLPTLEEIKNKFARVNYEIDDGKLTLYRAGKQINYDSDMIMDAVNPLNALIERTNISQVGVGSINFYDHIESLGENEIEFASYNDYYRICMWKEDNSIFVYSDESIERETIATDVEDFFKFLCEYNKYHRYTTYNVNFSKEDFINELNELIENGFSKQFIHQLIAIPF